MSDRNAKENIEPADPGRTLAGVVSLPLATWNYKAQDPSIRHIGPMAQDFREAFALGEDETTISTVDADGVALAAIQGLNLKLDEEIRRKDAEIRTLLQRLEHLERRVAASAGGSR